MELIDYEILNKVKSSIVEIAETIKLENNDNYLKIINNLNKIDSLFHDFNNNYTWPMRTRDFLKTFYLGEQYETVKSTIRRLKQKRLLKEEDYYARGPGQKTDIYEKGAITILRNTQSMEGAKFLRKFGIHYDLKDSYIYFFIIKYAVNGFDDPIKEYTIRNPHYRIDLYLTESKLAIECDEHAHEQESEKERAKRQEDIKTKLGCRFLRFDPHVRDFDIGLFIKVIFYYLLGKTINAEDPIIYWNKMQEARKAEESPKLIFNPDELD